MHDDIEPVVFVVNGNEDVRESLRQLAKSAKLKVQTYNSPQDFLSAYDPAQPGCLVLDVVMPGMSGLDFQYRLLADGIKIPVIFVTNHCDVSTAVRAMKNGAIDFIEKQVATSVFLDSIQKAFRLDAKVRHEQSVKDDIAAKISLLTSREREIMDLLVSGKPSRIIADRLGVTPKTVDFHRTNILKKMGVDSMVRLLLLTQMVNRIQCTDRTPKEVTVVEKSKSFLT
ncbi:MAG: response regulator transcription factor [Planctomycetota bacterium]|jgi:FixJ family two-component response regulator